jgi:beta-galactosidase
MPARHSSEPPPRPRYAIIALRAQATQADPERAIVSANVSIPESFSLGVCYYPEQWPADRWERYARQMRELGLTYVRIAEFAWSRIEPREGEYDWTWLDDAIAVLAGEGLRIVLCTPTATPPAWLIRKHPEILPVDVHGHIRQFGSRRHYDIASPVYREQARRIARAIAERYGRHPAVAGWQIDNELGDHETGLSYTAASRDGFRCWLKQRYGSLAALNAAWGTVFWSQEYGDWSEIGLPIRTVAAPNPSHRLDFRRFCSDMVAEFLELQVAVVREHSPGRWITHNYMRLCPEFDHYRNARELDFASWDVYPTGAVELAPLSDAEKVRWARTGHPDLIAFNHDLYRGLKPGRAHWVMETQAGQINWAPSNPLPAPGAVALWAAEAYAHGAGCVSYFRWRAGTAAQELMHSGLLRHDETLDRGGEEVRDLDLRGLPNNPIDADVVLLHDYDSLWIYEEQPHGERADYWEQMLLFYSALRSLGVDVDVRHPDDDLAGYRLIVAPALQIVDEARAERFIEVGRNAFMVFGPRTAVRTASGRVHESGQPGPLRPQLGCSLLNVDGMRPGLTVLAGGHAVETWAESFRVLDGDALVRYDDGPLAGDAAVVRKECAVTIGAWSPGLIRATLRDVLAEAGIAMQDLAPGVRYSCRGNREIWLNFNQFPVTIRESLSLDPVSYLVLNTSSPTSANKNPS